MADFANSLFLHSPVPLIALCQCSKVIAANRAAISFFCNDRLAFGCDYVCGSTCSSAISLDDLGMRLEASGQAWDIALGAAKDEALRDAADKLGLHRTEVYSSFTRLRKPTEDLLVRYDSPIDDAFPESINKSAGREARDLRNLPGYQVEKVHAKVMYSSFPYQGRQHYSLAFQDIFVTHLQETEEDSLMCHHSRSKWMASCQTALFDSMPFMGYILDRNGEYVYMNRLAKTTASGVNARDVPKCPENHPLWTADFSRKKTHDEIPGVMINRTRKPLSPVTYGHIDRDTGVKYLAKGWGSPIYDPDTGEYLGACVFTEVLGRWEELQETANVDRLKSFESICDTMPHYVWTADEQGYGQWFSSQWLAFTGLTPEQCRGWGWQQTIWPEDLERFLKAFKKAHAEAIIYEVEVRCRRHDGVYRWMLKKGAPIKDSNGKVLLWTGTNTEIHDSVVARIQAEVQRDQIVKGMEHAKFNVWAVSKDPFQLTMLQGSVLPRHADAVSADNLIESSQKGNLLAQSLPGMEDVSAVSEAVREVISGQRPGAEIEANWKGSWHKVLLMPDVVQVDSEAGKAGTIRGVIGCSIDITAEKMRSVLESDNRQLSEEKHQAKEQSRIKSKFLANMSHEIRTPVAGVIGLANLLLDSNLDEEQRDHVESIQISAQTLLMIVNDILDFSKVESGKLTLETIEFNLATLVTNLWKVMHHTGQQKSVDFSCMLSFPGDLCVMGDPGRIRQILTNLVSNAIKFTPSGGTVKLNVTAVTSNAEVRVIFMVEDSGIGIKKDVLANLFRPFQQGDSSTARLFGGSGLGLSISRSLALLMKGHIELDSTPNLGTTATFSVPLNTATCDTSLSTDGPRCLLASRPKSHASHLNPTNKLLSPLRRPSLATRRSKSFNDRGSPSPAASAARDAMFVQLPLAERAKTHILLAEDNAINRLIAVRSIEKLGFSVSAVWNGAEALSYLTDSTPGHKHADIVLMDCQMPVLDGYSATHKIRNEEPYASNPKLRDLPIVAMTASAIQGDREKCFDAGMSDYLSKPVEMERLEAMLVKWALSKRGENEEWDEGYQQWI